MNHKLILQKAALSAILLSAAAIPGAAFAADQGQSPQPQPPAITDAVPTQGLTTLFKASPAVAVKPLADPVELAKTYAPATVDDWIATLKRYDEAAAKHTAISAAFSWQAAPAGQTDVAPGILEALPSLSLTQASDSSATLQAVPGSLDLVAAVLPFDTALTITKPTLTGELASDTPLQLPLTTGVVSIAFPGQEQGSTQVLEDLLTPLQMHRVTLDGDQSVEALQALPLIPQPGFFQAQLELTQAAEKEEAEGIKQALAKLLAAYKEQLAQWEAAE